MTETIQQLKEDIAVIQEKLKALEETQMTLEKSGEFSIVLYNGETYYRNLYDGICGGWYKTDTDGEVFYLVEHQKRKLEKLYQEQVVVKEPEEQKWDVVRESVKWCEENPEKSVEDWVKPQTEKVSNEVKKLQEKNWYVDAKDLIEWDEKDNPKPMDEVVDRLIKQHQAQKLWNILKDKWGFSEDACGDIVEAVAEWLPKEQIAAGSQSLDTELLVDGFNDCVRKMKEMLR